jgi:hypothetical protein
MLAASCLLAASAGCGRVAEAPKPPLSPAVMNPLRDALERSYEDLFREAPGLEFSRSQIESMRGYLQDSKRYCVRLREDEAKKHDQQLRQLEEDLKRRTASISDEERTTIHCRIVELRDEKREALLLANHAIPVAYDNRLAKLDLIQYWPSQLQAIRREIEAGLHHQRQHGNVKDIGFRDVGRGQENDVELGRRAMEEMRQRGTMPKELNNEEVNKYVRSVAERIAAKSDLRVPVNVWVLDSKEVNAFALPGGFFFIQRGLLEAVDDEAQLAGVVAHELAHAAARHGHRLMRRATIASIIYQSAQLAALIFSGGLSSLGSIYAMQYGFYGLGMVLNLNLLGVSRDFELEADQLGVQYAWNAGYDPSGFTRFFDKIASREGYIRGASWFRTHPPFYERMMHAQREMMYLPKKEKLVVETTEFHRMKKVLAEETRRAAREEEELDRDRPSLRRAEERIECPTVKVKKNERDRKATDRKLESLCPLPAA